MFSTVGESTNVPPKRKAGEMVRKLCRYFEEHPHEPIPTLDDPPERLPWQKAA